MLLAFTKNYVHISRRSLDLFLFYIDKSPPSRESKLHLHEQEEGSNGAFKWRRRW